MDYLRSLYGDDENADQSEPEPLLMSSKLLTSALSRPSFAEKSRDHHLVALAKEPARTAQSAGAMSSRLLSPITAQPDPQKQLDDVMEKIEQRTAEYDQCLLETSQAGELVKKVEREIASLEQEEQELLNAKPPAADRLSKVQQWLEVRRMTRQVQQELAETKQMELLSVEASLRQAEGELDRLADVQHDLEDTKTLTTNQRSRAASKLQVWEEKAARQALERLEAEVARIEELTAKHEEDRERALEAAEEGRAAAKERLKVGMAKIKRSQQKGEDALAQANENRRQAVLSLKNNLASVRQDIARKAETFRMLQKQKKEIQEREFQDLLDQGLNPYEVYRKRDVEQLLSRQQKAIQDNIASRQVEIARQLAEEEEAHARDVADKERKKKETERLQKELGPLIVEQRTEEYMLSHTREHVTMLDPAGHKTIEPSKSATFKTKDFGLGHADPAILAEMQRTHPDVSPKDLLLPAKYRNEEGRSLMRGSSSIAKKSRALEDREDGGLDLNSDDDDGDTPPGTPKSRAGGEGEDNKRASGSWKVLETIKPLSKFETLAMDRAKARHRDNIGKSKMMMGRQFGGDAFMPTPAMVVFKDFDVNTTYHQKVVVTNRSYEKNTFRVVQVPPEFGDMIDVTYDLPGYIATGVSGELTVTFTPKQNEDIESQIEMLADTGPFSIPIRCLTKKADLKLSGSRLDFGHGVTLGETAQKSFTITNHGALAVDFSLSSIARDGTLQTQPSMGSRSQAEGNSKGLRIGDFLAQPSTGSVPGYGSTTITCTFSPSQAGPSSAPLSVIFKALVQGRRPPSVPPASLELIGLGRDVPVFLEETVIDFKCSMVDHTYRDFLRVRNGGKTAMKVSVINRHDIAEFFSFSPDFGFCQAGEVFPIKVQFCPKASMTKLCSKFLVDEERNIFEIPMKLNVPDQLLPVTFVLRAQVTSSDLVFEPPSLDFGSCVMNENTALALRITNPSSLPQTFGFVGAMPGVSFSPNDGFGHILPGETLERIVSFQPFIPGPQSLVINARTLAGRSFSLPLSAHGIQSVISVSHNKIRFPATPINDTSMVSLMLTNKTERPQAFEFGLPLDAGELQFIPNVGEIPAQSNFRVQVEFSPKPSSDSDPAANLKPSAADGGEAELLRDEEGEGEREGEEGSSPDAASPWYRWKQFSVTCFIRPNTVGRPFSAHSRPASHSSARELPAIATAEAGSSGDLVAPSTRTSVAGLFSTTSATSQKAVQQLSLNIETCAILPDISLKTELPEIPEKCLFELDFGPVPVGQRITRVIEILNNSSIHEVPISIDPLHAHQVFGHVNALYGRSVAPGGTYRSLLSFCPQERTRYMEVLTIHGLRTSVKVALKGLGIAPELKVEPKEALEAGFDMGDVFVGEQSEKKIVVTNVCPFPLAFSMLFRGISDPNLRMKPSFFTRPSEGKLAQGESAEVTIVFQPSNQRPYFKELMTIHVPNQQEMLTLPLVGRCWAEGLFISGPSYPLSNEDPFMEEQLKEMVAAEKAAKEAGITGKPATPQGGKAGAGAGAGAKKGAPSGPVVSSSLSQGSSKPLQLVLEFPHHLHLNETATASFEVGSLKSQSFGGAPGEMTLDEIPALSKDLGWSIVEGTKVSLAAGDKKTVSLKYSSPSEVNSSMAAFFGHSEYMELKLGGVLKGGVPSVGPDGRRVELLFRALLHPSSRGKDAALPPSIVTRGTEAAAPASAGGKKK